MNDVETRESVIFLEDSKKVEELKIKVYFIFEQRA